MTCVITVVVAAASSYDLTTLATVKAELGITATDKDANLARYITEASAFAAKFCNRVFPVEAVSDQFFLDRDPNRVLIGGAKPLQLSRYPILASPAAVVTEDGTVLTLSTDYLVDADPGQLTRLDGNGWPKRWPALSLVVVYSSGFATIPADVAGAVIRLVKVRHFGATRDPMLRQESVDGVWSGAWWFGSGPGGTGNLPPDVQEMLEAYRVPVIG